MPRSLLLLIFIVLPIAFSGNLLVHSALAEEYHGHKAHHGGVLNVIGKERGHIEIRLKGDTLEAWLVGGGQDTHRSVPVKASTIRLKVSVPDQGETLLVLRAAPMKLAGEKMGHCSHFIAKADWLRDIREFEARGEIDFKGIHHQLLIRYPEGYDPIHGHGAK